MEKPTDDEARRRACSTTRPTSARSRRLLDDKRQVIFQGPPGTGKTYAARELARIPRWIPRSRHPRSVPSRHTPTRTSFRATGRPLTSAGQAGFELRETARLSPPPRSCAGTSRTPRTSSSSTRSIAATWPRCFGELYFLLEYRDAGHRRLQYAADRKMSRSAFPRTSTSSAR